MWADSGVLFVASEKQGLIAFDIDEIGQLKRRMKVIDTLADHVVVHKELLVSASDNREITIWQLQNSAYHAIARIETGHAIQDLHINDNTLYVSTRKQGLMVYDISTPAKPRIYARYPSTDHHGKFIVHHDAVFFGGTHTIASIQLLPAISWQQVNNNELQLDVPANLPVGNYHLAIHQSRADEQLWPDALSINLPKRSKPKMTLEQFQQLLKQHRSEKIE